MKCWKCKEEMDLCWVNPWRKQKAGDRLMSGTFMCAHCETILTVRMIEIYDICDDDTAD